MNHQANVHHSDELDPALRAALETLLSRSPSRAECDAALQRMDGLVVCSKVESTASNRPAVARSAWVTAASTMFALMWFGAQTDAWGQVVVDYQALNTPAGDLAAPAAEAPSTGSAFRFLLMLHVFALVVGLIGITFAWMASQLQWIAARWSPAWQTRLFVWVQRSLLWSLCLYGTGICLGAFWAHFSWGSAWRWDPRESAALLTMGVAILWYGQVRSTSADSRGRWKRDRKNAGLAALAFWMIALIYVLTPLYTTEVNGYRQFFLPNLLSILGAANLIAIALLAKWVGKTQSRVLD